MDEERTRTTELLNRFGKGERAVEGELVRAIQGELHRLASALMAKGPPARSFQPTALINEAWIRLLQHDELEFDARGQFYALASKIMRGILVDHARAKNRLKREGDRAPLTVEFAAEVSANDSAATSAEILSLEEALARLESVDPSLSRVVEMRFYGGLSHEEIATAMSTSLSTVERNWRAARAFLNRELSR